MGRVGKRMRRVCMGTPEHSWSRPAVYRACSSFTAASSGSSAAGPTAMGAPNTTVCQGLALVHISG
jgi:hypothetical protein